MADPPKVVAIVHESTTITTTNNNSELIKHCSHRVPVASQELITSKQECLKDNPKNVERYLWSQRCSGRLDHESYYDFLKWPV